MISIVIVQKKNILVQLYPKVENRKNGEPTRKEKRSTNQKNTAKQRVSANQTHMLFGFFHVT